MSMKASGIVDHYATLGLIKEAPPSVVRAAWKALVAENHPDRNPDDAARIKLRRVNEAFNVLGKPELRAAYDRTIQVAQERTVAMTLRSAPMVTPASRNRDASIGALLVLAVGLVTFGIGFRDAIAAPLLPVDNPGATSESDHTRPLSLAKNFRLYTMMEASLKSRELVSRIKPDGEATALRPGLAQPYSLSLR